jgi:ribosomal protein S12 methylthiotransferase
VRERGNICAYFDVPIQHASSKVLKGMGRHYSAEMLLRQYERIRTILPDAALRTTVIVGFPGETDADFEILSDFVQTVRFDHLGVFTYSDSEDLPSHRLSDHVPKQVAQDRHDQLMSMQLEISSENNQKYLDQCLTVLLEEHPEENLWIGRTRFQAPEVDGVIYVHSEKKLQIGSFADVKITDTLEYDLVGKVESEE